jgi:predicted Zn finger-like uncharacterized protein
MEAGIGDLGTGTVTSDSAAMILTCPECATSYFVEDSAVGEGRLVRCASCGASWRAEPPRPLELTASADEAALGEPPGELAAAPFEPRTTEPRAGALPRAFRARAESERRTREAAVQGAIWAGMGASLALLVALAVVFRMDVVRLWPRSASAYASVGLAVNPVGLTIEDVHFQHALQEGRPALVVSGVMRNIRARPVVAPPLRIALLDRRGKPLMTRTVSPGEARVEPGQTRSFTVSLLDPPVFASDLDITFATGPAEPRLRAASAPRADATARSATASASTTRALMLGPPIPEAKPLPAGSPYALQRVAP